jgi:D-alanyl-D-alanine dipeptidase
MNRAIQGQAVIDLDEVATSGDFVPLAQLPGIRFDLRYATPDNFVGRDLYSPHDCAWLHREAAQALTLAAEWLARQAPVATLLVLDALRPQRVQQQLWDALEGTGLRSYLADPERGSIHSFGMAVDVTLLDEQGRELDMGTRFDDLTERSHPALERHMLERGELSEVHVANRGLLRAAMVHAGFVGIQSEWWHFDCGDREQVRLRYRRVL